MKDSIDAIARRQKNIDRIIEAQGGDEEALSQLVESNMGLVRSIAIRFCGRGTEYEDLVQIGTIGMLRAIRTFDVSLGNAFSTYAVPLIMGEIRRHLRDDGIIRVSRGYKKLGASLMEERSRIISEQGREPGIEELAKACGASKEEAAIAMEAISPVSSLSDNAYGEDSPTLEELIPDDERSNEAEKISDSVALAQSIAKMPPLWKKIVLLRYYRNMTQQQTAVSLGITQVKVSREEKKVMEFLRSEIVK